MAPAQRGGENAGSGEARGFQWLELAAGKLARRVLRGRGAGDDFLLPDTRKDPTNPWATKPLGRFCWKEKNKNLSRTEPTIDSCSDPFLFSEIYVLRKGLKTVLTNRSTSECTASVTRSQLAAWASV